MTCSSFSLVSPARSSALLTTFSSWFWDKHFQPSFPISIYSSMMETILIAFLPPCIPITCRYCCSPKIEWPTKLSLPLIAPVTTMARSSSNTTTARTVKQANDPNTTSKSLVDKIHELLKPLSQEQETEQVPPPPQYNNNPNNKDDDNDNDNEAVVVAFAQERFLTAWVLLTRLEQIDLDLIWRQYGSTILEPFAVNDLLQQPPPPPQQQQQQGTGLLSTKEEIEEKEEEVVVTTTTTHHPKKSLPAYHGIYLRLIAQVMTRLSDVSPLVSSSSSPPPPQSTEEKILNDKPSLGLALLKEWQQFSSNSVNSSCCGNDDDDDGNDNNNNNNKMMMNQFTIMSVHLDVLRAIEVWMEHDTLTAEKFGLLPQIWNHYVVVMMSLTTTIREKQPRQTQNNSDSKDEEDDDEKVDGTDKIKDNDTPMKNKSLDDWEVMTQTLQGILTSSSDINNNNNNKTHTDTEEAVMMAWHETVVTLFQSYGSDMLPDTLIPTVIEWITDRKNIQKLPPIICQAWHEWLLSLIQTRVPFDQTFRLHIFQQAKTMTQMNQLLLAHVVSPLGVEQQQHLLNPQLRALAWQTMLTLVESCGWQWVLMAAAAAAAAASASSNNTTTGSNSSRLGMAVSLCTWIRLASGEWRIQLQAVTNNTGTSGNTNTNNNNSISSLTEISLSSNHNKPGTNAPTIPSATAATSTKQAQQHAVWQQATGLPVGHACAQLLIGVVHFCVQLEEEQHHPHRRLPQLSVDALLHLRTSLQGGLLTTVEYLQELQREESQIGIGGAGSPGGDDSWSNFYDTPKKRRSSSSSAKRAAASSSSAFEVIAIKLLGTLLMEVDIWLLQDIEETSTGSHQQQQQGTRTTNTTTAPTTSAAAAVPATDMIQGVLECLQYILPESRDYSLLPGIVSILAGAEEQFKTNPKHVTSVMMDFWDPLVDYLEGYWQRNTTSPNSTLRDKLNDTVAWACSCTEMYVALDDATKVTEATTTSTLAVTIKHRHRRLALSLIEWIQTVLQVDSQELWSSSSSSSHPQPRSSSSNYTSSSPLSTSAASSPLTLHKLQSYLSLAVGCYMTLSKNSEQPPREHESRVIYRALQVCEMQEPAAPVSSRLDVP